MSEKQDVFILYHNVLRRLRELSQMIMVVQIHLFSQVWRSDATTFIIVIHISNRESVFRVPSHSETNPRPTDILSFLELSLLSRHSGPTVKSQ